ncbi:hypothetical protein FS842_003631 [Serendipita sp. 407]|nr:hypothetical protein FRC20_009104 [Serendipita sp. 405]KAG9057869.1 hypothetical protein FS842_003631 [Serendipita sp. 407]
MPSHFRWYFVGKAQTYKEELSLDTHLIGKPVAFRYLQSEREKRGMKIVSLVTLVCSATAVLGTRPPKTIPLKWGILAFPRFVGLDAYGPLEILNIVAFNTPNMTLSIIAETMENVPALITNPTSGALSWIKPTYTIDQDPPLDVLLVPGGPGSRIAYNNTKIIDYVKRTYPKLKYIMSTASGAQILAKAGVLDKKRATTQKWAWAELVASGPKVKWVPCARWVVDGNIWTSSGVAAGMDMTYAFVSRLNSTIADRAVNIIEYEPHKDPSWDPFCEIWNTTSGGTLHTMSI